jgi:hypothetical protein
LAPGAKVALSQEGVSGPVLPAGAAPATIQNLKVRLSWGHQSKTATPFWVCLVTNEVAATGLAPKGLEAEDRQEAAGWRTQAGGGDVDGLEFTLVFLERPVQEIDNVHQIWRYLIEHADADTVRRLRQDPGYRPDTRKLTVQLDAAGTRGFSVTVDQLLGNAAFWAPELDMFLAAGETAPSFAEYQKALAARRGQRILDQVQLDTEATYEQFTNRWEDMGSPAYRNPHSVGPGHIVCVTWDSAIPKFGIDRGAGVWNDYGNPDRFRCWFDFGDLSALPTAAWRGQRLTQGLPVLATVIERAGTRFEIEQFAYPLRGPPPERRGDIPMALLEKVRVQDLTGSARSISLRLFHHRQLSAEPPTTVVVNTNGAALVLEDTAAQRTLLTLAESGFRLQAATAEGPGTNTLTLACDLPANGCRELVLKLPSPLAPASERERLLALDYQACRQATLAFWSELFNQGALFEAPEDAVNTLFRANLWHALRLPRRHGGPGAGVQIDLPYSNFAYDQHGAPWPVNQAIYVDYMLYDLRGYHGVSAEELAVMFQRNQEPNGRIKGFANWGVYTPSLIYAVAKHYLLSGDRASLEKLLPQTLRALDWCLAEIQRAGEASGPARGLMLAPLNDLSHDAKAWAFNQAYLFAGPELLGRALAEIGHARAAECRAAARALYEAIQRGYARASVQSPLVQLQDDTWLPYVPGDALTPGRLFAIWYPTDVDTGPLHLARLKALDPNGLLTTALLQDHEDNLFFRQWGMANEPVYNPHATAYLLRDEVKPAIRAFYSMLACAFSHSTFEPVEHRWGWGQYFGPPSTDGAWFELYRNMLLGERDDSSLWLLQAAPRKWFEDRKRIRIERAPTEFGRLSLLMESRVATGAIAVSLEMPTRKRPSELLVRLRHPQAKPIRSVLVNQASWTDFNPQKEWVRIPRPTEPRYTITAAY